MNDDLAKHIVDCIEEGNLENVKQLLRKEFIDSPLKNGWTPLLHACMAAHFDIVSHLLNNGSKPNQHCKLFTPLMAVCSSRCPYEDNLVKCAEALVSHNAEVDAMDCYKSTALMIACRGGRNKLVSFLLNSKCDVNKVDNDGMTALHLAVTFGHVEIARMLLDHGARKDVKDRRGRTPLNGAIMKGLQDLIDLLQDPDDSQQAALPETYIRKKTSFEEMLAELPSYSKSSGKDGFFKDVEMLLGGMGLDRLAGLFKKNNVSLSKFFNITNKELKDMGVLFSSNRSRIVKENLRFIQHPWSSASLPSVSGNTLSMVNVAHSMANTAKHIHILWAQSMYCTNRLVSSSDEKQKIEDIYQVTLRAVMQVEFLMKELQRIHHHASVLEQVDEVSPVDLILPLQNSPRVTMFSVTIATVIVGSLLWKYNGWSIFNKISILQR